MAGGKLCHVWRDVRWDNGIDERIDGGEEIMY